MKGRVASVYSSVRAYRRNDVGYYRAPRGRKRVRANLGNMISHAGWFPGQFGRRSRASVADPPLNTLARSRQRRTGNMYANSTITRAQKVKQVARLQIGIKSRLPRKIPSRTAAAQTIGAITSTIPPLSPKAPPQYAAIRSGHNAETTPKTECRLRGPKSDEAYGRGRGVPVTYESSMASAQRLSRRHIRSSIWTFGTLLMFHGLRGFFRMFALYQRRSIRTGLNRTQKCAGFAVISA